MKRLLVVLIVLAGCSNPWSRNLNPLVTQITVTEATYQDSLIPYNVTPPQRVNVEMDIKDTRQTGMDMELRCEAYGGSLIEFLCLNVDY